MKKAYDTCGIPSSVPLYTAKGHKDGRKETERTFEEPVENFLILIKDTDLPPK